MSAGGVLCAGNIVIDILARPLDQVRWGTTTWIDSIAQSLGGNGASTAYTLAKLGARSRLLGFVGHDAFGEAALAGLSEADVDLSFVRRSECPTAASVVLVHPDGARALLHHRGSSCEAFAEPLQFDSRLADGYTRFHLANVFALPLLRPCAADTLRRARAAGLRTSLDTGWDALGEWIEVLGPCLPHLNLLFVNEDESRMLSGTADPDEAARFFRRGGTATVVVKLGGDGCAVYSREGLVRVPAFDVPVLDTTGAGDCFAGGFLAALEYGADYPEAARFANAVGALSVQKLGATTGVRSRPQTIEWMTSARTRPPFISERRPREYP